MRQKPKLDILFRWSSSSIQANEHWPGPG